MRKNTTVVYEAWKTGRTKSGNSISTDGRTIYSYRTPLLSTDDNGLTLNARYYSETTSRQQNDLRCLLGQDGRNYSESK